MIFSEVLLKENCAVSAYLIICIGANTHYESENSSIIVHGCLTAISNQTGQKAITKFAPFEFRFAICKFAYFFDSYKLNVGKVDEAHDIVKNLDPTIN